MSVNFSDISELSERYAKALFELAQEKKAEAVVEADLASLVKAIDSSKELAELTRSPIAPKKNMEKAFAEILKKTQASELTVGFMKLVVKNRRASLIKAIYAWYQKKVLENKGTVEAEVHTAIRLGDGMVKQIEAALKTTFKAEVRVSTLVKPEILGGLRVKVGSKLYDGSIASKIDKLELSLKEGLQKNLI